MSGQISSGLILLAVLFLLPGFIFAVLLAFFMRHYKRFRSWVRISLVLTVLGTAMWTYAVRYQGVDIGSMQIGTMASVVGVFSLLLACVAVWVVPRKTLPSVAPKADDPRPIKIRTPGA